MGMINDVDIPRIDQFKGVFFAVSRGIHKVGHFVEEAGWALRDYASRVQDLEQARTDIRKLRVYAVGIEKNQSVWNRHQAELHQSLADQVDALEKARAELQADGVLLRQRVEAMDVRLGRLEVSDG
jgi:hypothetical protein